MAGKVVNKRELSEILGVSERSLTDWQAAGMPMLVNAGRGASNEYDTALVVDWMLQRAKAGASRETQSERLARVRADREELALARELEEVAPAKDFEQVWEEHILAARSRLLLFVDQLAAHIESKYGIKVDLVQLQGPVDEVLKELAEHELQDDDFDDPDDESSDEEDS
jgi:phage terminase Nu1 subunit (DNA packaging protein)